MGVLEYNDTTKEAIKAKFGNDYIVNPALKVTRRCMKCGSSITGLETILLKDELTVNTVLNERCLMDCSYMIITDVKVVDAIYK